MRAVVYDRYGGPEGLRLEDVETPTPGEGEVLVRVAAAGVATGDGHLMRGEPFLVRLMFGLRRPKLRVLGSDVAGRVEAVGPGVTELGAGDEVFGHLADHGFGGFAEFVAAPTEAFVGLPDGFTLEEAAAVPGSALAALQALRRGGITSTAGADEASGTGPVRVLINGASGGVGTFAVQIARAYGAHVTGVCSARSSELVRSLGAHAVLDYRKDDFRASGERWDAIVDAAAHRPFRTSLSALAPGGRYVFVGGSTGPTVQAMLFGPLASKLTGKSVTFFVTSATRADLLELRRLMSEGKLRPVIDRRYTLDRVPDAIRRLESGDGSGKLVVSTGGARAQRGTRA